MRPDPHAPRAAFERAIAHTPLDTIPTSHLDDGVPGVQLALLSRTDPQAMENTKAVFMQTFHAFEPEVHQAVFGGRFDGEESVDYSTSLLPALVHADSRQLLAVSVVRVKSTARGSVLEVIWFSSPCSRRGRGFGSLLFAQLHRAAHRASLMAVVVLSTNDALPWWLTRRSVRIARLVLRHGDRPDLIASPADVSGLCPAKRARLDPLLHPDKGLFEMRGEPSRQLEACYTDTVFRNKRGRITRSSPEFQGRPYRYTTRQANHVIYPLAHWLVRLLGPHVVCQSA